MRTILTSIVCLLLAGCDPATRDAIKEERDARQQERQDRRADRQLYRDETGVCARAEDGAVDRAYGGTPRMDDYLAYCAGYVPREEGS